MQGLQTTINIVACRAFPSHTPWQHSQVSLCPFVSVERKCVCPPAPVNSVKCSGFLYICILGYSPRPQHPTSYQGHVSHCDRSLYEIRPFWRRRTGITFVMANSTLWDNNLYLGLKCVKWHNGKYLGGKDKHFNRNGTPFANHCTISPLFCTKKKKNFLAVKNKYFKRYNEKAFVQLKFEKEMPRIQNSVRLLHFLFLIYLFFFNL